MTTVLQYLVIAGVIGLAVFALAVFVFGRGEQLAPLSPRVSPTELPDRGMTAQDVRRVRFAMALRGYRMSDVDWALDRMADELDRLRGKIAALSGETPAEGASSEDRPDDDADSEPTDSDGQGSSDAPADEPRSALAGVSTAQAGRHVRSDSAAAGGELS